MYIGLGTVVSILVIVLIIYLIRSTSSSAVAGHQPDQERLIIGITTSLLLITAGAIMRFAVTAQATGFNVHTVGVILMIVGIVGVVLSIAFSGALGRLPTPDHRNQPTRSHR